MNKPVFNPFNPAFRANPYPFYDELRVHDPVVIRDRMMDLGVITRAIGADANTFCPSFVISDAQIDQIIDVLATALKVN